MMTLKLRSRVDPVYEEVYGFKESPFSLAPDPRFFYHGVSHIKSFESLRRAIQRGEGFITVTGDIGTGKTTLCRTVLEHIQQDVYTAILPNPFMSQTELLRAILQDFGVMSGQTSPESQTISKHDLVTKLNEFLVSVHALGSRAMILLDEAQNIPVPTLEQIRILSNLETTKEKLLQIVLVGQSELKDVLSRPELRQLDQRISTRCELLPLSPRETAEYIRHRIKVASDGSSRVTFTDDAIKVIYQYSGGIPRLINLIGDGCLVASLTGKGQTIDKKLAKEAVRNLQLRSIPLTSRFAVEPRLWGARIGIAVALAVLLSGLLLWAFHPELLTRLLGIP